MKQAIGKDQVAEKLDAVKRSPILMIDDIGADAMSSWIRDEVFGVILQYRMQEQLPTFFSSNFTMDELEQHLSVTQRGDEEPLKSETDNGTHTLFDKRNRNDWSQPTQWLNS